MLDPVAAYDRIASQFDRLSAERRDYLHGVERAIIAEIPPGAKSILDVGSGDGKRGMRIASCCGIQRLVLLEPSLEMRRHGALGAENWTMRAQELSSVKDEFEVILCLWNVLGHVQERVDVMKSFARLLSTQGLVFIDVNHRYNAAHYGVGRTVMRWARDLIHRDERNGDVAATWNTACGTVSTAGHVFTDSEFCELAIQAGLEVRKRFVIDYATGRTRRWACAGQLLYMLGRASRS